MCVCVCVWFWWFFYRQHICVCVCVCDYSAQTAISQALGGEDLNGPQRMQEQGTAFTPPCPPDHINTGIWDFSHFIHTTNTPVGWERGVWTPWTPGQSAIRAFPWQLLSILFFSYFGAFVKLRQDGNQEAIGADEKLRKEHDRFRVSQAFTVTVAFTTMLIASVDKAIDGCLGGKGQFMMWLLFSFVV